MKQKSLALLVEDSEDDAFFFIRTFEQSAVGYSVEHVVQGEAAIDFLQKSAATDGFPSIVFLDLKMPIMNGFEVLEWLQKQNDVFQVPVVVLSGSDEQSDRDRAFKCGAVEYLVKPVKVGDLQRLCGRGATEDRAVEHRKTERPA